MAVNKNNSYQTLVTLFSKRLPDRLEQLSKVYQQLKGKAHLDEHEIWIRSQINQLMSMAHASGLREIEIQLKSFIELISDVNLIRDDKQIIEALYKLIKQLESYLPTTRSQAETPHLIYFGETHHEIALEVVNQLNNYGCQCIQYDDIEKLMNHALQRQPDLILLNANLIEQTNLNELHSIAKEIPFIYFSIEDNVATRLNALRSGGDAFFIYPFEFSSLIEKIDQLIIGKTESIPYRVLIVEDSKTQAKVTKEQLESAQFITHVLSHPLEINEVLTDFQPDIILLDLYMPECSGSELARIIRQQEQFVSIPIVFLSSEANRAKQLDALSLGGDDFLTKPIYKENLISSVKARAARSRALKAEMIQDSLTGLLNHTRVLEQLSLEIARAERENETISFVMIDLDHFKSINDKYGHPVGDRVIKSLARILKQRLRKSDSIGRYGGEEFAVILPKTDIDKARDLIDEIRESFSKIQQKSNSENQSDFNCTFSAGVAAYENNDLSVDELCQAADQALYAAKNKGRNCVQTEIIAKPSSTKRLK